MSKFELTRTIEARKLNPRTGIPTTDPPVTIPFGAIIEDIVEDRDDRKFRYLGEPYLCPGEMLDPSIVPLAAAVAPAPAAPPEPPAAAAAEPAEVTAEPPEAGAAAVDVHWERLTSDWKPVLRAKVPGGWLVAVEGAGGVTFIPDSEQV